MKVHRVSPLSLSMASQRQPGQPGYKTHIDVGNPKPWENDLHDFFPHRCLCTGGYIKTVQNIYIYIYTYICVCVGGPKMPNSATFIRVVFFGEMSKLGQKGPTNSWIQQPLENFDHCALVLIRLSAEDSHRLYQ